MGAGKSSVGRVLGQMLAWPFEDLDDRIERREQRTVAEIFRDSGEVEFRRIEHEALKEVLGELQGGKVVALGGGAFAHEHNSNLLKAEGFRTIFLDAKVDELWRRCQEQAQAKENPVERPLLANLDTFTNLYQLRREHYLKASLRLETDGKGLEQIAAEALRALGFDLQQTRLRAKRSGEA